MDKALRCSVAKAYASCSTMPAIDSANTDARAMVIAHKGIDMMMA